MVIKGVDGNVAVDFNLEQCVTEENVRVVQLQYHLKSYLCIQTLCIVPAVWMLLMKCYVCAHIFIPFTQT